MRKQLRYFTSPGVILRHPYIYEPSILHKSAKARLPAAWLKYVGLERELFRVAVQNPAAKVNRIYSSIDKAIPAVLPSGPSSTVP